MTDADQAPPPIPLGFWATLGWALAAFVLGQIAAVGALVVWYRGDLAALLHNVYDATVVTISVLVIDPITIAILMLALLFAGRDPARYLGLASARLQQVTVGIAGIVVIIGLTDALLFLSGRPLVTPFQLDSYTSALAKGTGWLLVMLVAAVIVAPAGEEVMFRGFLFRGWARSPRSTWPAIVGISLLWAALHVQYDWTGILQIFVIGLFLGWMRLRSGSTLLTFLLHALFNLEGTLETVLQVRFFS